MRLWLSRYRQRGYIPQVVILLDTHVVGMLLAQVSDHRRRVLALAENVCFEKQRDSSIIPILIRPMQGVEARPDIDVRHVAPWFATTKVRLKLIANEMPVSLRPFLDDIEATNIKPFGDAVHEGMFALGEPCAVNAGIGLVPMERDVAI
jgi:hypothetical protein